MSMGTIIYFLSGIFGFIKFGESTQSNILNNLTEDHKDIAAQIGNFVFLILIFFNF